MSPSTNRQLVSTVPDQAAPQIMGTFNGKTKTTPLVLRTAVGMGAPVTCGPILAARSRTRHSAFRAHLCDAWALLAHINLNVRLLEFCGFSWTTCALGVSNMSSESAKCLHCDSWGHLSLSRRPPQWVKLWARWLGMILVSTCP